MRGWWRPSIGNLPKPDAHAPVRRLNSAQPTFRQRLNLSRVALAHPRVTISVWILIAIGGALAAWRLPIALFPDIGFPLIVVSADAPGLPLNRVERELTEPLEQRLLKVAGRGLLTSTSAPMHTTLTVPFAVGVSMATAEQRVRAACSNVALPPGAQLAIRRVDLNESPVVIYAVVNQPLANSPATAPDRDAVAELAAQLGRLPGVLIS